MSTMKILFVLVLMCGTQVSAEENPSVEEMLQLDEEQPRVEEEDDNSEPTGDVVAEMPDPQYVNKKFRLSLNGGFNSKSTITGLQPIVEHQQSKSPYYRLGFVYLASPLFSKTGLLRVFHFGFDVVHSKSVSSHAGALSSTSYVDTNTMLAPKLFAETPLGGLGQTFFMHFALSFNFYVNQETKLTTSSSEFELKSSDHKDVLSTLLLPGLELGFRYQMGSMSAIIQVDAFEGQEDNPWGAIALTLGAAYDY